MSTELFEAIAEHDLDRLAQLLTGGANPNVLCADWPAWTPLHEAINQLEGNGPMEALVLLLRRGAAPNMWDKAHEATPLLVALFRGQSEAVRLLLAAGADPNVVGSEGDSPLRWCAERGDVATAALLLRCGATSTINAAGGPSGMTALGRAGSRLDLPMMELLLRAGADPGVLDADQRTAWDRMPMRGTVDDAAWVVADALLRGAP